MAVFELTATRQMVLGNGMIVDKGMPLTLNIPMHGITPYNLMNNSRCRDQVLQQFAMNGVPLPPNSPYLNPGCWNIKMR